MYYIVVDSYYMCDCSIRVTAILEYIELVVPPSYDVASAHCGWLKTCQEGGCDWRFCLQAFIPQIESEDLWMKWLPLPL